MEANHYRVPEVIIPDELDRAWAASLIGGEGCIAANCVKKRNKTMLIIAVRMSDKTWMDQFARLVNLPPSGGRPRGVCKVMWDKTLAGLRALRFLNEILPYLYGSKKAEAERAIEFFRPTGYHAGRCSSAIIWPATELPLRKRPMFSRPASRPQGRPPV